MSSKFHRVFTAGPHGRGPYEKVADVPWADDGNGGLPDWYFSGAFFAVEIDPARDLVEWIPDVGPAPCWKAKLSSFPDDAAMVAALQTWAEATY